PVFQEHVEHAQGVVVIGRFFDLNAVLDTAAQADVAFRVRTLAQLMPIERELLGNELTRYLNRLDHRNAAPVEIRELNEDYLVAQSGFADFNGAPILITHA